MATFCFMFYVFLLQYIGPVILFISIFTFGLPLIILFLPLNGFWFFSKKKFWKYVGLILGNGASILFLYALIMSWPLRVLEDEAGNTNPFPMYGAVLLIVFGVLYVVNINASYFLIKEKES